LGKKRFDSGSIGEENSVEKVPENMQFYAWLDRRRRILTVLEESIEQARRESQAKTGRGRDNARRLEWVKILIHLLELYDKQLETIKRHIYLNSMPGAAEEPGQSDNGLIEFERRFLEVQKHWTLDDLKLKCHDCGEISMEVCNYVVPGKMKGGFDFLPSESMNLCVKCYQKRDDSAQI
jgi:hypothetical protein